MTELSIAHRGVIAPTARAGKTKEQFQAEIKTKRTHVCLQCKKEYVSKRKHLNEGNKFCSNQCAFRHKSENAKPKYTSVFFNTCVICSSKWVSKHRAKTCCSDECDKEKSRRDAIVYWRKKQISVVSKRTVIECKGCRAQFTPLHGNSIFCSERCSAKAVGNNNADRAKTLGVDRGYFNERRILVRDNWRCRLCGTKTPERLRGKNLPNSPEVDHIIPLSKGGTHRQHNLQCACRRCNSKKGSRPLGQLIMPGFGDIR